MLHFPLWGRDGGLFHLPLPMGGPRWSACWEFVRLSSVRRCLVQRPFWGFSTACCRFFCLKTPKSTVRGRWGSLCHARSSQGILSTWAFAVRGGDERSQGIVSASLTCPVSSIRAFSRPFSDKMAFARSFYPGRFAAFVKAARQWKELAPRSALSHLGCWIVDKRWGSLSTRERGRGLAGSRRRLTDGCVCQGKRR